MSVRDVITVALVVIGAVLTLLATIGILKMPDVYTRMQTATKASTLGVGLTMLAVAVDFADLGIATRVVLIIAFVLLTGPISAQMIGRAAYSVGVPLWPGTTLDELRNANGDRRQAPGGTPEQT